jgi:hypothetical protein
LPEIAGEMQAPHDASDRSAAGNGRWSAGDRIVDSAMRSGAAALPRMGTCRII